MSKNGASLATCDENNSARIERDHFTLKDFTILTDTFRVWLTEQKSGQAPTQHFEIPREVFNKLIEKYQAEQPFVREGDFE